MRVGDKDFCPQVPESLTTNQSTTEPGNYDNAALLFGVARNNSSPSGSPDVGVKPTATDSPDSQLFNHSTTTTVLPLPTHDSQLFNYNNFLTNTRAFVPTRTRL